MRHIGSTLCSAGEEGRENKSSENKTKERNRKMLRMSGEKEGGKGKS